MANVADQDGLVFTSPLGGACANTGTLAAAGSTQADGAAAGETISGQSGTTAISLAAKLMLRCYKYDASNWYAEKGVIAY